MTKENNIDLVPVEELSFEAALKELEQIVTQLDQGDVALEQSITIYERGEALKKRCSQLLQAAEAKVSEIKFDSDNKAQIGNDLDDKIVF